MMSRLLHSESYRSVTLPSNGISNQLLNEKLKPIVEGIQELDSLIHLHRKSGNNILDDTLLNSVPRIAVVGSQSSGKTSLLEALAGLPPDTLPKGQGIVTRLPLCIHVRQASYEDDHVASPPTSSETPIRTARYQRKLASWITFDHHNGEKFDLGSAHTEIQRRTDEILSHERPDKDLAICISSTPIVMHVHSTSVVAEISFIDLPGLTRVPLTGQPADLCDQLRALSLEYCTPGNVIILALTPLNTDLANSESLTLAKSVDPFGKRTIGILTKADLVEKEVDVSKIMTGSLFPLPMGYFAVMSDGTGHKDCKRRGYCGFDIENSYFENSPPFLDLSRDLRKRCGIQSASRYLVELICSIFSDKLPKISKTVANLLSIAETSLKRKKNPFEFSLGSHGSEGLSPNSYVLWVLQTFTHNFYDLLDGRLTMKSDKVYGGAKIQHIFVDVFKSAMEKLDLLENLSTDDITLAIKNSSGVKPSLFVPEQAFETLVKRQLRLFERPCLKCVDSVFEEMQSLFHVTERLTGDQLEAFPNLKDEINRICSDVIHKALPAAKQMVRQLLDIEHAFIHTAHSSFNGSIHKDQRGVEDQRGDEKENATPTLNNNRIVSMVLQHPAISAISSRIGNDIFWVQIMLKNYLGIVRMNLLDSVPKSIMRYLVCDTKEVIGTHLIKEIYQLDRLETLLKVSDENQSMVKHLEQEVKILSEIQDKIDLLSSLMNKDG